MATFSFKQLNQTFDFTIPLLTYSGSEPFTSTPAVFGYTTVSNDASLDSNLVLMSGTGLHLTSGRPDGGTVTAFVVDLNSGDDFNSDLSVSGLSFNFSLLNHLTDDSLTETDQNDLLWRTLLSGNDTINFGSAATPGGFSIYFGGDGSTIGTSQTLIAGNDTLTGDVGSGSVFGDVYIIQSGATVYGGDDTINVSGKGYVFGDARSVGGILFAGDDKMTIKAGDSSTSIAGDAEGTYSTGVLFGGDDIIVQTSGKMVVSGDLTDLFGGIVKGGDDLITGNNEANQLVGDVNGIQSGTMQGGDDTIHGGGGSDRICGDWQSFAAGKAVGGDDKLYGDSGTDMIYGNSGNDLLDGGADLDQLFGGAGNDIYVIDNPGDLVDESITSSEGVDTVQSSVLSIDLTNTTTFKDDIERATLLGSTGLNLTGNDLANVLTGNTGANTLNGSGGADVMQGLAGDDRYFVDTSGDVIKEVAGGGMDKVYASVGYTLKTGVAVEVLGTTNGNSTANLNLVGNEFANTVNGNAGVNLLSGMAQNDSLNGLLGNDKLTGGTGDDFFVFTTTPNGTTNFDRVADFSNVSGNDDQFQLENSVFTKVGAAGALSSVAFRANAAGTAADLDDRILYKTATGELFYDADGNKAGGVAAVKFASIDNFASLTGAAALSIADFFII